MEVVLVDTDVFSYLWQDRPEAVDYRHLVEGRVLALSFTSIAEAYYGAFRRGWGQRRFEELEAGLRPYVVLPYNRDIAVTWARLRAEVEEYGIPMESNDLWIAATGISYDVPLITNNRRHFDRVPQLQLLPSNNVS